MNNLFAFDEWRPQQSTNPLIAACARNGHARFGALGP